jgi:class 3 adenylate cyclase
MTGRERKRYERGLAGAVEPQTLKKLMREGERVLTPAGGRRRASIVHAQLQGYQGPAGDASPSAVVRALREWADTLSRLGQAAGARVDRVLGHSVVAGFGDLLARPEHAVEAVSFAVAAQAETARYQQSWSQSGLAGTQLRLAVATGDVVLGDVGGEWAASCVAVGGAAVLAETLVSKAPPGGILVSDETRRACQGRFELQAVPGFALPGHADLYVAHLVLGPRLETDPERVDARLSSSAEVVVRTAAQAAPGRVDNVSAGGMHVSCVLALRVGDTVSVEFAPVPELSDASAVVVHGRVRHLRAAADGSPGFGLLIDRADALDSQALRHFVALYFAAPPTHGDAYAADGGDFYRLELGPNYLKLLRGEAGQH